MSKATAQEKAEDINGLFRGLCLYLTLQHNQKAKNLAQEPPPIQETIREVVKKTNYYI